MKETEKKCCCKGKYPNFIVHTPKECYTENIGSVTKEAARIKGNERYNEGYKHGSEDGKQEILRTLEEKLPTGRDAVIDDEWFRALINSLKT